ncbi:NAD-dependent epimerase/dehydratase family protein [Anaerocolumna sp. MB42-C2]|uniref:NAD-dependent epimerase/dehydratase family protein n=1 Tax=Anaerocolumna sp. MB42-C2 TaxID=3070997 RepID=UPI0027DF00C8|nr:NAD(P)-dependent oxidoreductase [Anaerocolumna sp. MB42-C2]WMJ89050.1 NAD(P)-dependent oxidoreductase [Anaerocolumna sp. MB42-C2]
MKKIVVTGGSGKLGVWVIKDLLEHGYEVLNVDSKVPKENICDTVYADLRNLGEAYGVLQGADAVLHLAAIPVAFLYPNEVTFQNNVMATYNILEAAAGLGIQKAVLASSETAYGIGFAKELHAPVYVPLDEEHPCLPEDPYGLSKVVSENIAEAIHRRTGMQILCLRFGYIHTPEMFKNYPEFNKDPWQRVRNLWNYIDVRDAASACRLGLETDSLGCLALNIVADETCMDLKSLDLMTAVFPEVKDYRGPLDGYTGIISNKKAKQLLNWKPVHSWRDNIKEFV